MEDYVKRYVSKDGTHRITIYYDEYAENPRDTTDEPLHCNDWSRGYSIMVKDDPNYSDARSLINQMLVWYGKREIIIDALCKGIENNKLVYNRSMKRWELKEYIKFYSEKEYKWYDAEWFNGRKDDIDLCTLIEACLDSTIDELCDPKYLTDGIKMCSYGFGYNGDVSFYDSFSTDSEGIAWLEKDEFLKYSGCDEEYWKKDFKDIEWLLDELKAWGDNEVYHYSVEKRTTFHIRKECTSEERDILEYDTKEWEDVDSCSGFYGDINYCFEYAVENTPFKKEDFSEVR